MEELVIESTENLPKIERIVNAVISGIMNGILKKGAQLPSISRFSEQYAVSRDTVEKAYNRLKKRGYIQAYPGRGNFVTGKRARPIRLLLVADRNAVGDRYSALVDVLNSIEGIRAELMPAGDEIDQKRRSAPDYIFTARIA